MKRLFYILLLLIMVGCSKIVDRYHIIVDAVSTLNGIKPARYVIKALGESVKIDKLKFQRQSSRLIQILNRKGYSLVPDESMAEEIIYFDYGIEKIKEELRVYREPDASLGFSWGYPYGYYSHFWHHDMSYTRYRTYSEIYHLFNRYIIILSKNRFGKELWRVDVSSIGESNNLAKIIPILLQASVPYIGRNIDRPNELNIDKKNNKK